MIPKIIHYCWFGRNPLPDSAQKCIASWRKFLPDYEIWQWSEEPLNEYENEYENENLNVNKLADKVLAFDVNSIRYTKEAYEAKKYAFVSDYARFWILYHYGGLYFDTDVEIIKPMDDIIKRGAFMGVEIPAKKGLVQQVNPGLGLAVEKMHQLYKEMLEMYATLEFVKDNGQYNEKTIVTYTTEVLLKYGLKPIGDIQKVAGIWIYPPEYFNPLDDLTGKLHITANTRSIHWFMNSWSDSSPLRRWLSRFSHRVFGMTLHKLRKSLSNH